MTEALIESVLGNLSSLVQKEIGLFLGFDQELERITSLLTAIKATLEDAEEKQFTDKAIKDWLQKLKDAAQILDDILDECATKALELKYKGFNHGLSFLSSLNPKHAAFRYKVAKKTLSCPKFNLSRKPKYERRDALKLFNYDAQSSFSSFDSSSSVYTCSTDLNDRTSFRIDGIEGDFDQNCRSLRLSGREDFANPAAAAWGAMKFRSSSYILPSLKIEEIDLQQKEEDELSEKCEDRDRDSVRVTDEVAETVVVGSVNGIRPPMIKPPPGMRVRVVDNMCSTWDLLKELGPVVEGEEGLLEAGTDIQHVYWGQLPPLV